MVPRGRHRRARARAPRALGDERHEVLGEGRRGVAVAGRVFVKAVGADGPLAHVEDGQRTVVPEAREALEAPLPQVVVLGRRVDREVERVGQLAARVREERDLALRARHVAHGEALVVVVDALVLCPGAHDGRVVHAHHNHLVHFLGREGLRRCAVARQRLVGSGGREGARQAQDHDAALREARGEVHGLGARERHVERDAGRALA
mmetsp:Transcript_15811/g.47159  ORF Transcript_15811/g.47159 Transcript_15811/m.47159 type:complete len:206 (-) Transcript_15811:185-802(-)